MRKLLLLLFTSSAIISYAQDSNNFSDWKKSNYVDEFGDKTDVPYIYNRSLNGKFSNTATTNSLLVVDVRISNSSQHEEFNYNVKFDLIEYGSHHANDFQASGFIKIKTLSGEIFENIRIDKTGLVYGEQAKNLFNIIKDNSGVLKFFIEFNHYLDKSTYRFKLNSRNFDQAIDWLQQ